MDLQKNLPLIDDKNSVGVFLGSLESLPNRKFILCTLVESHKYILFSYKENHDGFQVDSFLESVSLKLVTKVLPKQKKLYSTLYLISK